ncbi:electron transfer flavoprotein subunit beta/FixA family protein [Effusibacillus lacus]|uniref:Electron transfer flavoprotein subunit beta n=1 Tax=Effusibacillus lacus TaxID=1348429 RepID=A0A292YP36_9BACL|nr:electron transfer flavoprotein subunit beta/FixA family protein [Effusibacillus lacus]TCS75903.1 electron transfer flavoprotein beta subunit [Effusibacillus lacus]GAX91708.1 electron transfer flavoprotein subunit beta [Effusibacillus lacus]
MDILVCVKHVVDSTEVRVDKKSGEIVLRGIPTKINDYDKNAIEEAVRIKQTTGGTVTLLTVGPKEAFKTVKEGLAMGADKAYLIDEGGVNLDDPIQVAKVLAAGIKKLGKFDLIFCGTVSEDRGNSLTGPSLAEWLDMEHVAYVNKVDVEPDGLTVERRVDQVMETINSQLPVVLTVDRSINTPRLPTALQVMKVQANRIVKWIIDDLGLEEPTGNHVHFTGFKVVPAERKRIVIEGDMKTASEQLMRHLVEEGVL